MKPGIAHALVPVFGALFLSVLLFVLPFAWILRDGLGPDSVDSSGLEAILRCLRTLHVGTALGLLALLTLGCALIGGRGRREPGS